MSFTDMDIFMKYYTDILKEILFLKYAVYDYCDLHFVCLIFHISRSWGFFIHMETPSLLMMCCKHFYFLWNQFYSWAPILIGYKKFYGYLECNFFWIRLVTLHCYTIYYFEICSDAAVEPWIRAFAPRVGGGWGWGRSWVGCLNPIHDRHKSLKQIVTASLPYARQ